MQRFFVNGPHIKKTVPSPEKENEPKQISRRVLPRNSATPHTESAPSLSHETLLLLYPSQSLSCPVLLCLVPFGICQPQLLLIYRHLAHVYFMPGRRWWRGGNGAASFVICIGLQNEQQQQQKEKRKKFQIFLNEFNIHKVWKILLGKLRKAPKKQTTGSQAAIIIVLIIILIALNMLIILQTFSSSSSSPSSSTSSSSSSATWFRSRHTPVHVSFMSSYMISGLCLLICSHNNFYATPCVHAPRPSRAACKGFSCCNQFCANLGQVPGTSTPTKRGKWERVEGRGRTVGRGR